jgi:hypothetical protein
MSVANIEFHLQNIRSIKRLAKKNGVYCNRCKKRKIPFKEWDSHHKRCDDKFYQELAYCIANGICIHKGCTLSVDAPFRRCNRHQAYMTRKILDLWARRSKNSMSPEDQIYHRKVIFSAKPSQVPLTPAIARVMRIWADKPQNVGVGDLEVFISTSQLTDKETFQITIANASGRFIIDTLINHNMTRQQLLDLRSNKIWCTMVWKHYGHIKDDEITPGRDWEEMAKILDDYIYEHGPFEVFLEWGTANGDWMAPRAGLESVGRGGLMQYIPKPEHKARPYTWWSALKDSFATPEIADATQLPIPHDSSRTGSPRT